MPGGGSKHWCVTLNNPTRDEYCKLSRVQETCNFSIGQLERGEEGTIHVQSYFEFAQRTTLAKLKTILGARIHAEPARGSTDQNIAYCSKESSRYASVPGDAFGELETSFRHGVSTRQPGQRRDLEAAALCFKEARTLQEAVSTNLSVFLKYSRGCTEIFNISHSNINHRDFKTKVIWCFGSTGTGKSRWASEQGARIGSTYWKDPTSKWWDGYYGQDCVIIDDYRRDFSTFSSLLRLFDRYPLQLERKVALLNSILSILSLLHQSLLVKHGSIELMKN